MISEQKTTGTTISSIQRKPRHIFLWLLALALLFELLYLLLLALSPLPGLHLSDSPLVKAWPWTLAPSRILIAAIGPFIQTGPARTWLPAFLLGLTFLGLAGAYGIAIFTTLHLPLRDQKAHYWLYLLLGTGLIFGLTLFIQPLLLSDDVFTYIFSGRILAIYHADPLNAAPSNFPGDPYFRWVINGRYTANTFGPLWLWISSQLAVVSSSPLVTLLLFKGLELVAHLLNILQVWAILSKVAPNRRIVGSMAYAWNPLALIELSDSGHNEGFLTSLLLLAVLLYIMKFDHISDNRGYSNDPRHSWLWSRACEIGSLLIFGLAISTNLLTLLLVPLLIWFEVHAQRYILWNMAWRSLVMLVPTVLISQQFWHGPYTFFAITSAMDMEHFVHAPVGLLAPTLRYFYQAVATQWHIPAAIPPTVAADVTLRASATFIFILIYSHLFGQVRRAFSAQADKSWPERLVGFDQLFKSWGVAIFWYMILVSGWFWPWYLLWMFWVIALQRLDAFNTAMLVLSCTALFIYPFVGFTSTPIATYQAALIFGVPLVYLIIAGSKQKSTERTLL